MFDVDKFYDRSIALCAVKWGTTPHHVRQLISEDKISLNDVMELINIVRHSESVFYDWLHDYLFKKDPEVVTTEKRQIMSQIDTLAMIFRAEKDPEKKAKIKEKIDILSEELHNAK